MLPKKKTPPKTDLSDFTICIYGPTKIGKSTFASRFPDALFLPTEPGLNALECNQWRKDENSPPGIFCWEDMLLACSEIRAGDHAFKTIVIDTADNAYKLCEDYVCTAEQIRHPNDLEYGKGAAFVNNEFQRVLTKLAALPYGLILVSHAKDKEVKTPTGKYNKTAPTLPGGAYKIILGMADMVLYCDNEETAEDGKTINRRIIKTKPTIYYEAGDRTGRLPETLPLSYQKFLEAFQASAKQQKAA
jgi:hypothetical protein